MRLEEIFSKKLSVLPPACFRGALFATHLYRRVFAFAVPLGCLDAGVGVYPAGVTVGSRFAAKARYVSAHASAIADKERSRVFADVDKVIHRLAQLAAAGFAEGDNLHLHAVRVFKIFDERDKVAVAGCEDYGIELLAHCHRIYRHSDVPVGLFGPAGKDSDVFDFGFDAELVERFKKALLLVALGADNVGYGAD